MNKTITELRNAAEEKEVVVDILSDLYEKQLWYMDAVLNEDGSNKLDSNGDPIYDIPDPSNDRYKFTRFMAYQKVIDAVYKMVK